MSESAPVSLEERHRILERHKWEKIPSSTPWEMMRATFWGLGDWKVNSSVVKYMDGWPDWKNAIQSKDKYHDIRALAHQHEVHQSDISRFRYVDLGDISPLRKTKGLMMFEIDEYEGLLTDINEDAKCRTARDGVIITGQPGIGKKYFLFYVLLHRLSSCAPVLFHSSAGLQYLFLDIGTWMLHQPFNTLNDTTAVELGRAIGVKPWVLLQASSHPPPVFYTENYLFWPVLFAPPDRGIYDAWMRDHQPAFYVMSPLKPADILNCGRLLADVSDNSPKSLHDVLYLISILGPVTKECLKCFDTPPDKILRTLEQSIRELDLAHLEALFRCMRDRTNMTSISVSFREAFQKILVIRPSEDTPERPFVMDIPSLWIYNRLVQVFNSQGLDKRRSFVEMCMSTASKSSRVMAGEIVERVVHHMISSGASDWVQLFEKPVLFREARNVPRSRRKLPVPNAIIESEHILRRRVLYGYPPGAPPGIEQGYNVYHMPDDPNNPTFDSSFYAPVDLAEFSESDALGVPSSAAVTKSEGLDIADTGLRQSRQATSRPDSSMQGGGAWSNIDSSPVQGITAQVDWEHQRGRAYSSTGRSEASQGGGSMLPPGSSVGLRSVSEDSKVAKTHVGVMRPSPTSVEKASFKLRRKRAASAPSLRDSYAKKLDMGPPDAAKSHCIALQMTIAKSHSVKQKGMEFLWDVWPREAHWHIVYVTPKGRPFNLNTMLTTIEKLGTRADQYNWYHLAVDLCELDGFPRWMLNELNTGFVESDPEPQSPDVESISGVI